MGIYFNKIRKEQNNNNGNTPEVEVLPPEDKENEELKEEISNLPVTQQTKDLTTKEDFLKKREELIEQYHKNAKSLFDKIQQSSDGSSIEQIITTAMEELIKETDNLLGNELALLHEGSLRDASVVSVKRADVLDTLSKVAVRKKEVLADSSKVDLNSPVFKVFQTICFERLVAVLEELNIEDELRQLIVMRWGDKMDGWDKELESRVENLLK